MDAYFSQLCQLCDAKCQPSQMATKWPLEENTQGGALVALRLLRTGRAWRPLKSSSRLNEKEGVYCSVLFMLLTLRS